MSLKFRLILGVNVLLSVLFCFQLHAGEKWGKYYQDPSGAFKFRTYEGWKLSNRDSTSLLNPSYFDVSLPMLKGVEQGFGTSFVSMTETSKLELAEFAQTKVEESILRKDDKILEQTQFRTKSLNPCIKILAAKSDFKSKGEEKIPVTSFIIAYFMKGKNDKVHYFITSFNELYWEVGKTYFDKPMYTFEVLK